MPKYALRITTALALVALMSVVAISLMTDASDVTAFSGGGRI